jgi:hypothetical protein
MNGWVDPRESVYSGRAAGACVILNRMDRPVGDALIARLGETFTYVEKRDMKE